MVSSLKVLLLVLVRLFSYQYTKIAKKSSELLCAHPDLDNFGLPLE